jgi:coenzyme F420-reducing hydrogenase delta subunit
MRLQYSPDIKIIRVPCSGTVKPVEIIRALESGIDGVMVAGCLEGGCHFIEGNLRAKRRVEYVKRIIEEAGLEPERVEMFNLSSSEAGKFVEIANEMAERIRGLGSNPIKTIKERNIK